MEKTHTLYYLTPTGRYGHRNVKDREVHSTIARLIRKGYTGFRVL